MQNEYITDIGAVPIMGVTVDRMTGRENTDNKAFQKFLLDNENIVSIEKSNTPQRQKWWILGKKIHSKEIINFLNNQGLNWMEKQESEWRDYVPPQARTSSVTEIDNLNTYAINLKSRLNIKSTPTVPKVTQNNPTYAQKVERNLGQERKHIGHPDPNILRTQQHTIITANTTEPSTLTNTEEQQRKMQEQIDRQGQQMENMLNRINQMMDTMQQMFSTVSSILLKVLPDASPPTDLPKDSSSDNNTPLSSLKSIHGGYLSTVSPITRVL